MSDQDKKGGKAGPKKTGAEARQRRNPAIEVVNVYGSGPLPIGPRPDEKRKRQQKAVQEDPGALSTSVEGKLPSGKGRSG